jgi:predicted RNase H-like nuclease (RuvC/YqgF family)
MRSIFFNNHMHPPILKPKTKTKKTNRRLEAELAASRKQCAVLEKRCRELKDANADARDTMANDNDNDTDNDSLADRLAEAKREIRKLRAQADQGTLFFFFF